MKSRSAAIAPGVALTIGIVTGSASGQEQGADRRSIIEEVIVTAEKREESEMTVPSRSRHSIP